MPLAEIYEAPEGYRGPLRCDQCLGAPPALTLLDGIGEDTYGFALCLTCARELSHALTRVLVAIEAKANPEADGA